MDNGLIVWSPSSQGFAVQDSNGSGESSIFSYVDASGRMPHRVTRLRNSAEKLYLRRFNCPTGSYVYSWIDGWNDGRNIRLVVQEGVHSARCPHGDPEEIEIGIVGDPLTGQIGHVLSQGQLTQRWCTAKQRREFGYCYDTASANAHP
jgi:hypothetical protein